MSNYNDQYDDEKDEPMSFFDFILEVPISIVLLFYATLWAIAMGILLIYIKYVR